MEYDVQVDMASKKSTAYENYADIKKAVESASLGLYSNYGVQIQNIQTINEKVIMHLRIPNDIADNFSIGNHMRGVATYLMKNYNEKYSSQLLGKDYSNTQSFQHLTIKKTTIFRLIISYPQ